jgi:hypothetical protein
MTNEDFAKLCSGTSEMLAVLAKEAIRAGDGNLRYDRKAVGESIKPLADIIAAIAGSAE